MSKNHLLLKTLFFSGLLGLGACAVDPNAPNHPYGHGCGYSGYNYEEHGYRDEQGYNGQGYHNEIAQPAPTYSANGSYDDNGVAPPPNNGNQNFGRKW